MNDSVAQSIIRELEALADKEQATHLQRFFKTGKGEYGEGDKFYGIQVPQLRKLARGHRGCALRDVKRLLNSHYHEARFVALLLMVDGFEKGDAATRQLIYVMYLANTSYINNWDLVDVSAPQIVGGWLGPGRHPALTKLARSTALWERRIAILATLAFIRDDYFDETLRVAKLLLNDRHDLIHKAVGWMLREVGNRDRAVLERFLAEHRKAMPRTTLRYAIEKLPLPLRRQYLAR